MPFVSHFGFSQDDLAHTARVLGVGFAAADVYLQDQELKRQREESETARYYELTD